METSIKYLLYIQSWGPSYCMSDENFVRMEITVLHHEIVADKVRSGIL